MGCCRPKIVQSMVRRPPTSSLPESPGVYLFRDPHGAVLYVGKAKSIRKRLASYFVKDLLPRTKAMLEIADSVEWIVTDNEVAALMLEYSLVQDHQPRFNIRLRDDKSFPYLAITRYQDWPRAMVMRGKRRKGTQYFGPYAHASAIRQTLDLIIRTFPVRTCTDAKLRRHQINGSPCLLFHIERCAAPCIDAVTPEEYAVHVDGMARFLSGETDAIVKRLRSEMQSASDALEYEQGARIRDQLVAVERAMERQELVSQRKENFDLLAFEEDELEAVLVVLNVKQGRVTGRKVSVIDKVSEVSTSELVGVLLGQLYGEDTPPPVVLVQQFPDEVDVWKRWLAERRGSKVDLRQPQRGSKRSLMKTASVNAKEEFNRHRLKRRSDHNARARSLRSLQVHLQLEEPPLRIECYDVSTIQGRDTVGSMVVFEDSLPRKSDYRRFKIRSVAGQDDFAALEEMLRRRFIAYLSDQHLPVEERGKFSYPPSLVVIDGGLGHLGRAVSVLDELGIDIPVIGLAKKLELVYRSDQPDPLVIPRGEEALYLLQQIRDEAHRFAITYHRVLRRKRMVVSVLDAVPGIGPVRKKLLLRRFGSLRRLRDVDVDALAEVVPLSVATDLYDALHSE